MENCEVKTMHGVIMFKHETSIKSHVDTKFFQLITKHCTSDYSSIMAYMEKSTNDSEYNIGK